MDSFLARAALLRGALSAPTRLAVLNLLLVAGCTAHSGSASGSDGGTGGAVGGTGGVDGGSGGTGGTGGVGGGTGGADGGTSGVGGDSGGVGGGTCTPETDAELCTSLSKNCGSVSTADRCGVTRSVECGSCTGGETCGGGGEANVCGAAGDCTPTTNVPSGWSYLDNGSAKIGVNLGFGAAIGHFSVNGYNVLNSGDSGRYLQQSYYGNDIGGSWHGNPWPFNPVQGGSSTNQPSQVTEFCNNGTHLYAKTIPLDWGGTGVTPTIMEEWITLDGDMAVIRFRFEYQGSWDNGERHQEVPALFVQRELEHLIRYEGNAPWTGGAVTSFLPKLLDTTGDYVNFTESWLAYVNSSDWGIGLYKRDEDYATCYRFQNIGDSSATSYFAFIDAFALTPGTVHDYVLYAKIGQLQDIRSTFYDLHQKGL